MTRMMMVLLVLFLSACASEQDRDPAEGRNPEAVRQVAELVERAENDMFGAYNEQIEIVAAWADQVTDAEGNGYPLRGLVKPIFEGTLPVQVEIDTLVADTVVFTFESPKVVQEIWQLFGLEKDHTAMAIPAGEGLFSVSRSPRMVIFNGEGVAYTILFQYQE